LSGKTDANFQGVRASPGEHSVVKPASTAEAAAVFIEGEARAEERVDGGDGDLSEGGSGFLDVECPRDELGRGGGHDVKREMIADNARIEPGAIRVAGDEIGEIDFTWQGGINREGV
jgi:hypothetical protein